MSTDPPRRPKPAATPKLGAAPKPGGANARPAAPAAGRAAASAAAPPAWLAYVAPVAALMFAVGLLAFLGLLSWRLLLQAPAASAPAVKLPAVAGPDDAALGQRLDSLDLKLATLVAGNGKLEAIDGKLAALDATLTGLKARIEAPSSLPEGPASPTALAERLASLEKRLNEGLDRLSHGSGPAAGDGAGAKPTVSLDALDFELNRQTQRLRGIEAAVRSLAPTHEPEDVLLVWLDTPKLPLSNRGPYERIVRRLLTEPPPPLASAGGRLGFAAAASDRIDGNRVVSLETTAAEWPGQVARVFSTKPFPSANEQVSPEFFKLIENLLPPANGPSDQRRCVLVASAGLPCPDALRDQSVPFPVDLVLVQDGAEVAPTFEREFPRWAEFCGRCGGIAATVRQDLAAPAAPADTPAGAPDDPLGVLLRRLTQPRPPARDAPTDSPE